MSVTFHTEPFDGELSQEAPWVNMTNTNARLLLEVLGLDDLEDDLMGECEPDDFLGRVLLGAALSLFDEGAPAKETVHPSGARIIHAGRSKGYVQERLADLHALAEWAVKNNRTIFWA